MMTKLKLTGHGDHIKHDEHSSDSMEVVVKHHNEGKEYSE